MHLRKYLPTNPKPAEPEPRREYPALVIRGLEGAMASQLEERYDERIAGVLSCYDRVVVTGTLPSVCYAEGMTRFLFANAIPYLRLP